ncbi:ribosome biogenesis GTPase Der [Sphingorhabdus sp. IMCC26285]|uniref:GTPase Der n=1 Tax=Sphingorhabdus profundilacus TaxID=2509718 RepID=A0A6I4LYQ1_9SPHN|nr:ribosome biogenesis GTPase Der [Sphingorhabdus profundilacus]MVZ98181.1 ribosome biogenesis GTPase Der [Sphingorhabdus profundilacus]
MLPTVAIIGRPNVGKSTLFNRLVGKKLALVDDTPGVTRDRREGQGRLFDLEFTIVDTAGYEDEDPDTLPGRMRMQTEAAISGAQVALFLIDGRVGVTPLDEEIARWLRSSATPVVLAVNKAEGKQGDDGILESYALGFGDPIAISGEHGEGMADLFQALLPHIDGGSFEVQDPEAPDAILKLAIVGRPNAGKSTLINKILGENRLITGPEAGITRDSISIDWIWTDPHPKQGEADEEGNIPPLLTDRRVRLIDTAGMRKRAKVQDKLEKLSVADARHAIDFAEVVVLLLDATKGLEVQDLKIADHVIQEGRALIIAINKRDIAENGSSLFNGIRAALEEGLSQLKGVPLIAVSAATGKGLDVMISAAFDAREAWNKRVPTGILNRWFEAAVAANPPPAPGGKRIKLRYMTQARNRPPTFVIFGNRTDELPASYARYLLNGIRRDLDFGAVPVRINFRSSKNPFAEND